MPSRFVLWVVSLCLSFALAERGDAAPSLLAGQRILVLGDSITQNGAYVGLLEYYHTRLAPGETRDLISLGLSSETLSGLTEARHPFPRPCVLERLDRALAAVKPTLVIACYGMNDGIYHPPAPERLAAFEAGLDRFIATVRAAHARLLLLTPPVFDPQPIAGRTVPITAPDFGFRTPYEGYNAVLATFAGAIEKRAAPDVQVVDLQAPLLAALTAGRASNPAFSFTADGIHPDDAGHLFIARTIARALGLSPPTTPLAEEIARLRADPLLALVQERRALRAEAWLPFVGYTREKTFRSASVRAVEEVAQRLQGEIDQLARNPQPAKSLP